MMRLLLGVVLLACAGLLSFSGTASASSTVLTFDDVATSPWTAVMPAGYGGLSWENFYVVDGNYPPIYNSGYRLGVVSPPKTAYNGNADPATIRSSTSFNFMEAYFAVAYSQTTEPSQVQIDGYLGNILKYSRRVSAVTTGPTLATLNYNGIDRLVFTSLVNPADRRRSQFVMDNFAISSSGYEADTSPRPDGSNNGAVTIADWTQVGRFVAGLDVAAPGAEFQRADCAPRAGLGDGRLTIADWVQAGRYATGLDPVVASGGPIVPAASLSSATGNKPRLVERQAVQAARLLVKAKWQSGQNGVLAIELDAVGNENALGFSFSFDPQQWRFASATVGLDASEATLHINETESASGRVGLALALPAGQALAAGTRQIVTVKFESNLNERSFRAFAGRRARFSGIEFGDYPVKREAADVEANVLSAVSP
jgi:hypothetical protein